MKKILLFFIFLLHQITFSQEQAWVYFNSKENVTAAIANPISILTQRAIDRKNSHNISIDERDVPINEAFVTTIKNQTGIEVKAKSKWFNCVHVLGSVEDINALSSFSFVDKILFADTSLNNKIKTTEQEVFTEKHLESFVDFNYGNTSVQIEMLHVDYLHENNYTGEGMLVAVMDAGFPEVNTLAGFSRLRNNNDLIGGYDFVDRTANYDAFAGSSHGTLVLSNMAGYIQNSFVGTAPDASYYLFRTEDTNSETPLEESYWVEAAERADSLGVDVINTSLGYSSFDNPNHSYTPADMDGDTAFITKGANIAVEKGILVVVSAGNSGNSTSFNIIAAPADGQVYSVGAVDATEQYASFSSIGPTADGRVKPDGMAQGSSATVIDTNNQVTTANGTSFSSPIMAGAITSLWQSNPNKTNLEIMQLVRESSSLYTSPTNQMGYGIPNFETALKNLSDTIYNQQNIKVYPNPVSKILYIQKQKQESLSVKIYNLLGKLVYQKQNISSELNLSMLSTSIYIAKFEGENFEKSLKIIKQ
ncbi:Por secretion system C-terminal sorting domain-containing protein [Mesonia phycicola]|uniref:Por secretion system C-terminal sorting domain-containing protein n=1 Tax=Mesonia phycicola TaxID=579105 RepID=A0A1M6DZV9_9FLAO|nr:S8 family serine peptidase [Mesonia phycicola]SHI78673.1 Por secretion system C-terminal sorting domain-containing protein [Mesonia phycicola]